MKSVTLIAIDTNLLVYAHRAEMPLHAQSAACVAGLANGHRPWAIPWPCLHEFFGVVTNPLAFKMPSAVALALDTVDAWMESPGLQVLHESAGHWLALRSLVTAGNIRGGAVHDARIAAICIGAGVRELWSADRDFRRFPALKTRNPLAG